MMKILLTGASGGLGLRLLKNLVGRNDLRLTAMTHINPVSIDGCASVPADLTDYQSLLRATAGQDTVVHLAALVHAQREKDYFEINKTGTKNLLRACVENNVRRIIYISTRAANPDGGGYALSKLRAEELVKKSGLDWTVIQPSEVYGIGENDPIQKLIALIRKNKIIPVIGNGLYRLSPVFVDDAVSAIAEVIKREDLAGRTFILAGPEEISFNALVKRLSDHLGVRRSVIHVPVIFASTAIKFISLFRKGFIVPDQIPRLMCDKPYSIKEAEGLLNFKPRKLEDGLRR